MNSGKWSRAILLVIVGAFMLTVRPVLARTHGQSGAQAGKDVHLQAIALIGVLNGMAWDVAVAGTYSAYKGKLRILPVSSEWESVSAELGRLTAKASQPDNREKIGKFYTRLQELTAASEAKALEVNQLTAQGSPDSGKRLHELVQGRVAARYTLSELLRHWIQDMDLSRASQRNREKVGEMINIIRMEQDIQVAITVAFYENWRVGDSQLSLFWNSIASFDMSYGACRALVEPGDKARNRLLDEIKSLKDQVVQLGGELYEAKKAGRPQLEAKADELMLISTRLSGLFKSLRRMTI